MATEKQNGCSRIWWPRGEWNETRTQQRKERCQKYDFLTTLLLKKWKTGLTGLTFAKTSGTVTGDKEKKMANSWPARPHQRSQNALSFGPTSTRGWRSWESSCTVHSRLPPLFLSLLSLARFQLLNIKHCCVISPYISPSHPPPVPVSTPIFLGSHPPLSSPTTLWRNIQLKTWRVRLRMHGHIWAFI